MPQPPQWSALLFVLVSQPSPPGVALSPLQSANGSVQSERPHMPSTQLGVPPAVGQAFGQLPQCSTLMFVSVSQPSERPLMQSSRPVSQTIAHSPKALHSATPPLVLQTVSQLPQVVGLDRSASQPFAGSPSQSAKPELQSTISHTPEAQVS